ncbi:Uncharacterized protein Fot_08119 [Forsythia ovata]|uniref:Uncharacterized protein n=1 Tax=Forsythia ovata TaxID=205694 RepID=A0ABD1WYI2_9LAMI
MSNSTSANNPILPTTSSPLSVVAPKRKRPRQVSENPSSIARSSPSSMDQNRRVRFLLLIWRKSRDLRLKMGMIWAIWSILKVAAQPPEPILPEAMKLCHWDDPPSKSDEGYENGEDASTFACGMRSALVVFDVISYNFVLRDGK